MSEMDEHLWSLANVITGFSVAQNIALLYSLGKDLSGVQNAEIPVKRPIAAAVALFAALYVFSVWHIYSLAVFPNNERLAWLRVTEGRTVAIVLFSLLAVAGLFAPELYARFSRREV